MIGQKPVIGCRVRNRYSRFLHRSLNIECWWRRLFLLSDVNVYEWLCIMLTVLSCMLWLLPWFSLLRCRAIKLKCLNAETPDKYGHYREAKFSQIKHHWFWKVSEWLFLLPWNRDSISSSWFCITYSKSEMYSGSIVWVSVCVCIPALPYWTYISVTLGNVWQ